MLKEIQEGKKSTLVQIINEVDELSNEEKKYLLYWLRAKKNAGAAANADATIKPNGLTLADIYKERNALRKQKK
jgi:hypothetical protein